MPPLSFFVWDKHKAGTQKNPNYTPCTELPLSSEYNLGFACLSVTILKDSCIRLFVLHTQFIM